MDRKATVLIVDDQPGFRRFARRLLEAGGLRVIEAVDGPGAIASVSSEQPDLVLLDIQLPGIDGFAVAQALAEAGADRLVVVLTSARDAADYGGRVAAARAAGFLPKAQVSADAIARFLWGRA
jgi:CheY-like chemotaxis protein